MNRVGAAVVLGALTSQVSGIVHADVEKDASKKLQIPQLELVASHDRPWSLADLEIQVGYVEQDTNPGGGKYQCGSADGHSVAQASRTIANALDRLDSGVVQEVGLKYLLLCGGLRAGSQSIGGAPIPPLGLLAIDLSASRQHLERVTLHEFFHYAEYRTGTASDAEWRRRFDGYQGGAAASTEIGSGSAGFINGYAMMSPQEDRAELFALLMTRPEAVRRFARRQDDAVLKEKIKLLSNKYGDMFDSWTSDL